MNWLLFFFGFYLGFFVPCRAYANDWLSPPLGQAFGVQVKEGRTTDAELDKIRDAGLSYVRFVIPWYEVEKTKNRFVWGHFAPFIKRLRDRDLKAVVVLGGGHPDYTGVMDAPEGNLDRTDRYTLAPATDEQRAAFARYAVETVRRFGSEDIVWELWNEPDSDRFWSPRADAQAYALLAEASCKAIREVSPDARIIGPGMAETAGQWGVLRAGFLGALLRSPAGRCLDALSLHPYRDGEKPPESVLSAYERLRAFIRHYTPKNLSPLPFLATEWGFTLTDTAPEEQADFLLRSFMLNALSGVPLSIWYEWRDARKGEGDPEAHFGLLSLGGEEKPSYRALLDFLPPLKDARVIGRLKTNDPRDFVLDLKHPDGRHSLVLWTSRAEIAPLLFIQGCSEGNQPRKQQLTKRPARVDCGFIAPFLAGGKRKE